MSLIFSNDLILNPGGSGPSGKGKYVPQWKELPEDSKYDGYIVEYSGETILGGYRQGYFYKCTASIIYDSTIEFTPNKISISGDDFVNKFLADPLVKSKLHKDITEIKSGTMTYDGTSGLWTFIGKDASGKVITDPYIDYAEGTDTGYERLGFTFTGPFEDGEVVEFVCSVIKTSENINWTQINVQPSGGSGGTGNYEELTNLPKVNSVTLIGNKSASDLGLATKADVDAKSAVVFKRW